MQTVRITRASSAHPSHEITQDAAVERLAEHGGDARRLAGVARRASIATRRTVVAASTLMALGSIEERNRLYRNEVVPLTCRAVESILDPLAIARMSIVAAASCTGYDLPGLSGRLIGELGLPSNVARVPMTEAGCAGGVVALTVVTDHLRARAGKAGLAIATELCSLAYQSGDDDGILTSNLIFGDGAGAALLEASRGPGIEIVDTASVLVPDSGDWLGFRLTDSGFSPVLDRRLADGVPPAFACAVKSLLQRHDVAVADIGAWLLHPGGARILAGIERCLGIPRSQTQWSWQSLYDYGNTSSAAIFDVLSRFLDRPVKGPDSWVLIAAFGPGVSIDMVLGRQSC